MYIVKKNDRKVKGSESETYEKARQFARKTIRKWFKETHDSNVFVFKGRNARGIQHNNIPLRGYGYKIVSV